MYAVIAGCGSLGRRLAENLSGEGNEVVVLDSRQEALDALSPEFGGFRLLGDAGDLTMLRRAKLGSAELVIAATDDDNTNLFVSQAARLVFSVGRAMARVHDPSRERVFRRLGIETVCPAAAAAGLMLKLIREEHGA